MIHFHMFLLHTGQGRIWTKIKLYGTVPMYYHYYENGEHAVSPHFGISTGRYKLIRFYTRVNSWELFDLEKDPSEMLNIYGKKGYDKITVHQNT